jgi:hypothetical protein
MGCCSAAGGRGLHLLWEAAAESTGRDLKINLWLDADSSKVKISHDVLQGVITITSLQGCDTMSVRIPSWLSDTKNRICVSLSSDDHSRSIVFNGNYMVFSDIPAGASVRINYPVREVEDIQMFCGDEYRVFWRGNKVVEVLPKGIHKPLYVRDE